MKDILKKISVILITFTAFLIFPNNINASENQATLEFKHVSYDDGIVTTNLYLDTNGNTVYGVTADFTYSSNIIQIKEIDTENMLFDNYIETDSSNNGFVYISCFSINGVNDKGNIATIKFESTQSGEAVLEFTDDVLVLDTNSENILSEAIDGTYTITEDLEALPQTGTEENILLALVAFILLIMIVIFAISGFTMWGGIYFSLGKWKVDTKGEFSIGKKDKKKKSKRKNKSNK